MASFIAAERERSPDGTRPTLVGSYRNRIQAFQRWTKLLLYRQPIQGYNRLAKTLRSRFARMGVVKEEDMPTKAF
ncbi:hypothetical protein M407DRAFT_246566 [Tulasnella calospora MUT 4182]|uniref:Uncharacterized protein n=1 Tax=Tulasnella calospora MUT 4182 TaxID=1051891 RepID=A0A0C3L9E9_9AGAM|nr:hypothetical protein M407DRAFT_246566 [Tulasnella calospora MUT 4182]